MTIKFGKVGDEFQVNSQAIGNQTSPTIARLTNGGFVVSWTDEARAGGHTISAQIYDASGAKVGVWSELGITYANTVFHTHPTITGLTNGGFVLSWTESASDPDTGTPPSTVLKGQVFNAFGGSVTAQFAISGPAANAGRYNPTITHLSNGGFVASWDDDSRTLGDNSFTGIRAQIFNATGGKIGGEFLVNSQTANGQYDPTITGLSNGRFVVSWHDFSGTLGDSSYSSIKAQIFDATGGKVGGEFPVNSVTEDFQIAPIITGLSNGGFVVSWLDYSGTLDGDGGIKAQIFNATGGKIGGEFLVNSVTFGTQQDPAITSLSNGGFVVSWTDYSRTLGDSSGSSIKAQVFSATGAKLGDEFLVNTYTNNSQQAPTITGLSDGRFVVSWTDNSGTLGDTMGSSIKAQIFGLQTAPTADSYAVRGSDALTVSAVDGVLANDTDAGFQSAVLGTGPSHAGSFTFSANGAFSYVAATNFVGTDTFTYRAIREGQTSDPVTVTIDVLPSDREAIGTLTTTGQAIEGGALTATLSDVADPDGAVSTNYVWQVLKDNTWHELAPTSQQGNVLTIPRDQTLVGETVRAVVTTSDPSGGTTTFFGTPQTVADLYDRIAEVGGELVVNSQTAGNQDAPAVASLSNGGFVMSWTDGLSEADIKAQVFNAAGGKVGSEFLVNSYTQGQQGEATVTGLSGGRFVVSWDGGSDVKAQIYNATGGRIGGEFVVNTQNDGSQGVPTITSLSNGGFVVSWIGFFGGDADGAGIRAQLFDANGVRVGKELLVNSQTASDQYDPAITGLSNGGFVVSWYDYSGTLGDNSGTSIKARLFSATGTALGNDFLVNSQTANFQTQPTITGLTGGGFVVSWTDDSGTLGDNRGASIKAQIYTAAGAKLGGEFLVNSTTAFDQVDPTITGLSTGGFVVSWADPDNSGVKAQVFDAAGGKVGSELHINGEAISAMRPTVASLPSGRFVVGWAELGNTSGDPDGYGIKARIFEVKGAAPAPIGTLAGDSYSIVEDGTLTVKAANGVLANDTDPGDLHAILKTGPSHAASFVLGGDGSFNYVAAADYVGRDTFTYAGNRDGLYSNPVTVTINVTPVEDEAVGTFTVTGQALEGGMLTASLTNVVDPDGAVSTAYSWQRLVNGTWTNLAGQTSAELTIPGDQSFIGRTVRAVAITTDVSGGTTTFISSAQTIANVDDTASGSLAVTGQAVEGGALTAALTNVSDPDGAVSVAYLWQERVNGVWTALAGQTNAVLTIPGDQSYVGKTVRVIAISTDALGGTTAFLGIAQTVANVEEPATGTLAVSGDAQEGGVLTARLANLVDPDGAVTTAYHWQELVSGTWTNIAGRTAAVLTIPDDQSYVGKTVRAVATTTDPHGGATNFVGTAHVITNVDDAATGTLGVIGTPVQGGVLTAALTDVSDADGAVIVAYAWQELVHGSWIDLAEQTSATLTIPDDLSFADKTVRAVATTTDALGSSTQFIGAAQPIAGLDDPVKVGEAVQVNSQTAGNQGSPAVTSLSDGGFVLSWTDERSGGDIKAQVFDAAGDKVGDEFPVNTYTDGRQGEATIAGLSDGGFVVSWQDSDGSDGGVWGVKAQLFDVTGGKIGSEFVVNTQRDGYQGVPTITSLSNGGFAASWIDFSGDADSGGIKAQLFDANGSRSGGEFLVNSQTEGGQYDPAITGLAGGGFVVSWYDHSGTLGDDSGTSIKAQIFDASGDSVGNEFLVNSRIANDQSQPTITGLAGGGFVVSWTDASGTLGDDGGAIKAQIFNAAGAKLGGEFLVNSTTAFDQSDPTITGLSTGGFVVSWTDPDSFGVKAQVFDAAGGKVGSEFLVSGDAMLAARPAIAGLPDGRFVVGWTELSNTSADPDGYGIKAQIFEVKSAEPAPIGTLAGDSYSINEDGTLTVDAGNGVLANDPDTGILNAILETGPSHAVDFVLAGDGSFNYVAAANYVGTDTFTYIGVRDDLSSDPVTVTIVVTPVEDDATGTLEMTGQSIEGGALTAALTNVADPDGSVGIGYSWQELLGETWTNLAGQTNATLTVPDDQSFVGKTVRAIATTTDELGGTTAFLGTGQTIANVDDPAAGSFGMTGRAQEGGALVADLAGLVDADGPATVAYHWQELLGATWTDLAGQTNATLTIPEDQSFVGRTVRAVATTTDALGGTTAFMSGPQTVADINDAPEGSGTAALPDGTQGTPYQVALSALLAGFSDPDGDALSVDPTSVTVPGGASYAIAENVLTITLPEAEVGPVRFGYTVTDGHGGSIGTSQTFTLNPMPNTIYTPLNSYTLAAGGKNLTFIGTGAFTGSGNGAANVITGGAGDDNLDGKGEADTLIGLGGNDSYVVDNAGDVIIENAGGGTDSVVSVVTYTLLRDVENITLGGSAAIDATGNGGNNYVVGNGADNRLSGLGGNDALDGGAGVDTVALSGKRGDYIFTATGTTLGVHDLRSDGDGTDTVVNVERIEFEGSAVAPVSAVQSTYASEIFTGSTAKDLFFFDTALGLALSADTINNFAAGDRLVLTSALFDSNSDGLVTTGNRSFKLPSVHASPQLSAGSVKLVDAKGKTISSLKLDRVEVHDGVDFYVYGAATDTDTGAPLFADHMPPTLHISASDLSLGVGEAALLTFTFSEVPVGFTIDDIILESGTLSGLAAASNWRQFTATYTPAANLTDASVSISVATGSYSDSAGNGGDAATLSLAVNTVLPPSLTYLGTPDGDEFTATAPGNWTIRGGAGDDDLTGVGGADRIFGDDNDDHLAGGGGNDEIDGGAGIDTLMLTGRRGDYLFKSAAGKLSVTDLRPDADGTDSIANLEVVEFLGGTPKPVGSIESTFRGDELYGTNSKDVFFFDTALGLPEGADKIADFGAGDRLVLTTRFYDGNNDGYIQAGSSTFKLPGVANSAQASTGSVRVLAADGKGVTVLRLEDIETHDGVSFYVYAAASDSVAGDPLLYHQSSGAAPRIEETPFSTFERRPVDVNAELEAIQGNDAEQRGGGTSIGWSLDQSNFHYGLDGIQWAATDMLF